MFWLAVIGGGLVLLHATILFVLRLRKNDSEKQRDFGALVFPRFEVFLIILALPCVCQASAALIRGNPGKDEIYVYNFTWQLKAIKIKDCFLKIISCILVSALSHLTL